MAIHPAWDTEISASVRDLPLRGSAARKPLQGAPARREKQILQAAVDRFYQSGYAGTSVEEVAGAVGMLKGSLYHYIDSKEDLLYRIVEQIHEDHAHIIAAVGARTDLTPLQRFQEYIRQQVLYHAANLRHFAVYWQDRDRLSPERRAEIQRWRVQTEGFLTGLIRQAIAGGELPATIDPRLATDCIRGLAASLPSWYRPDDSPTPPEQLAQHIVRFLLDGIRGSGRAPGSAPAPAPVAPISTPARPKRKRRQPRPGLRDLSS